MAGDFPSRVRLLRREKGLIQDELGNEVGLTGGAVGLWETGKHVPGAEVLNHLADFFGVSLDFLMGRSDRRKPEAVKAYHLEDGHEGPLPPEAQRSVDEFAHYIRSKYGGPKPPAKE